MPLRRRKASRASQNLIGLEFSSRGRRELYRLRPKQCLLALGFQNFVGQRYVACIPLRTGFGVRVLGEPDHRQNGGFEPFGITHNPIALKSGLHIVGTWFLETIRN
jgi:hypothetical protein